MSSINWAKKKGGTKTFITAIDIYTGEKHTIVVPTAGDVNVPIITEKNYVFANLDRKDGSLTVLNDLGEEVVFQIKNDRVLSTFITTLDEYEKGGQDRTLIVTTVCSLGMEEPSKLLVEVDEEESCTTTTTAQQDDSIHQADDDN